MRVVGRPPPRAVTAKLAVGGPSGGKYASAVKIAGSLPFYRLMPDKQRYTRWLSKELEQAGCLFVKIGQWVSSRADIFPEDVVAAFEPLRKDVSPMPHAAVRTAVRQVPDLVVDRDPLSCGSVAQVHAGTYRGTPVAVKIRRPNLEVRLDEDLGLIRLALWPMRLVNRRSYDDAVQSLDELGAAVKRETDFEAEAVAMGRFAQHFEGTDIRVPRAHYASDDVIVMDYIPSLPLAGADACRRLIDLFLEQAFELGLVHTDMHAGNLGMTDAGDMVLYDFGSVQPFSPNVRDCVKRLFVSYLNRDARIMLDYMIEYGVLRCRQPLTPDQRRTLETFVDTILDYVERTDIKELSSSLKSMPVPATLDGVDFCPELFMVMRSFTLLEGLCKTLDPDFVILDSMMPYAMTMLGDPELYHMKIEDDLRSAAKAFGL